MVWQFVLQIVLIFCNAVFACAEIAIISINDTKLDKMAAGGDKRAMRLKKLTSEPSKFLATIQVAITLSGFIGSAFAADNFSEPLVAAAMKAGIPIPENVMSSIAVILITLILSYFTLVFGELVPKRLAMKKAESMGLGMSGMITVISRIFAPIVWLLNVSTNGVLRLLGIDPNAEEENVTEEEILMMSDAGAEKGTIDRDEHRIIKNIFAFDDMEIGQICTHRTEVAFLASKDSDEDWHEVIDRSRHSRLPVYGENVDKIIGVLDTKTYYRLTDKSRENVMARSVDEPYFVHESMKADVLFDAMKSGRADHFAIVLDEYGGVSGIVTITDLVEQLVGEFTEALPNEMSEIIEKTGENQWAASGIAPLSRTAEALNVILPVREFDTLGAYLMAYSEEFPRDGEVTIIETDVLTAKLVKVNEHRIEKCILSVKAKPKSEDASK